MLNVVWLTVVGLVACVAVVPGFATEENAGYLEVPVRWNCSVPGEVPADSEETLMLAENDSVWFLTEGNRQCVCTPSVKIDREQIAELLMEQYPNATFEIETGADGKLNVSNIRFEAGDFGMAEGLRKLINDPEYKNKAIGYFVLNDDPRSLYCLAPVYRLNNMTTANVWINGVGIGTRDVVTKVVVFEP
ncbi:MAG: hypothetical protein NTX14_04015 [Candidatus Nealsonbacteria bacterium]|nr:hypothetical protein [Candidatus Nealsonbacteria bacterium]